MFEFSFEMSLLENESETIDEISFIINDIQLKHKIELI